MILTFSACAGCFLPVGRLLQLQASHGIQGGRSRGGTVPSTLEAKASPKASVAFSSVSLASSWSPGILPAASKAGSVGNRTASSQGSQPLHSYRLGQDGCRTFSSIPDLCPLDAGGIPPLGQPENSPDLARGPDSPPAWKPWHRPGRIYCLGWVHWCHEQAGFPLATEKGGAPVCQSPLLELMCRVFPLLRKPYFSLWCLSTTSGIIPILYTKELRCGRFRGLPGVTGAHGAHAPDLRAGGEHTTPNPGQDSRLMLAPQSGTAAPMASREPAPAGCWGQCHAGPVIQGFPHVLSPHPWNQFC